MARCGVAVYGLDPFQGDPAERGLRPALSLRSYVADVKRFAAGDSAGYGQTWRRRARDLRRRAAARLRRRRAARALQQRRGAGRRPPLPARRHRLDGQRDRSTSGPRPTVEPGEEAVLIGAQGEEAILAEELAAPPRHDQLRGHLRRLGPGAAARRDELRRPSLPNRRRWSSWRRGGRWGARARSGSSAARCATRRSAARSTDLDLAVAGDPGRGGEGGSRPSAGGHAFELSAEFGTWRAVGRDRSWQIDVDGPAGSDDRGRPRRPRLHARRGRRRRSPAATAIDPLGGLADLERAPAARRSASSSFARRPAAPAARRAPRRRARARDRPRHRCAGPRRSRARRRAGRRAPAGRAAPACSAAPTRCAASRCSTSSA